MVDLNRHVTVGRASGALLLGGAMWGLYWIPVRRLGEMGLPGTLSGLALYSAAILLLSPFVWAYRQNLLENWRSLIWSGAFTGAAFGLFTISLAYTDVVRSILLFYLTPVWSTLLGIAFLGERLSKHRALGIALGLAGLAIVLGNGSRLPLPESFGDWLALASGIAWAFGTFGIYQSSNSSSINQVFAFLMGGLLVTIIASLIIESGYSQQLLAEQFWPITVFSLVAALYVLPMVWLTIWPASMLSPARVGLLLMSEVVVGLVSAALFANEPFGWREFVGAVLIVGAAVSELSGETGKQSDK